MAPSEKGASAKVSIDRKADANSSPGTGDVSHYSSTTPSSVATQPQKEIEKQTNNVSHNTMAIAPPPAKTQDKDGDNIEANKNEGMDASEKSKDDAQSEVARDENALKQAAESETKKSYAASSYKKRKASSVSQSDVPVATAPESALNVTIITKAQFPGGETEQQKFIKKTMNINACKDCKGDIIVSFVVNATGELQDPKIIKGISGCECLATEALRIVKAMPYWEPGKNEGKPVNTICSLSIKFE